MLSSNALLVANVLTTETPFLEVGQLARQGERNGTGELNLLASDAVPRLLRGKVVIWGVLMGLVSVLMELGRVTRTDARCGCSMVSRFIAPPFRSSMHVANKSMPLVLTSFDQLVVL